MCSSDLSSAWSVEPWTLGSPRRAFTHPGAQRCSTCGANFETLPEDLRPTGNGSEPAAASAVPASSSAASSPPDWLKKFYAGVESEAEPDGETSVQELPASDSGEAAPDLLDELFPEIKKTIK